MEMENDQKIVMEMENGQKIVMEMEIQNCDGNGK